MTARIDYAAYMPEHELQQLVSDLCWFLQLLHFHPLNSKGMSAGWPDSTIVGTKVIFRELKSAYGHPTAEQRAVGDRLRAAGADWGIWRPGDWISGAIERELKLLKGQPVLPFEVSS